MPKESPANLAGNTNIPSGEQSSQLSDDLNRQHLSSSSSLPKTANGTSGSGPDKSQAPPNTNNNSTPTASPTSSPTKSTPSKSRNKRKNDAKRRSANMKKQQHQSSTTKPTLNSDQMPPEASPDGYKEPVEQEQSDNQQPDQKSKSPSPSPKKNQPHQMDSKPQANNKNITTIEQQPQEQQTSVSLDPQPSRPTDNQNNAAPSNDSATSINNNGHHKPGDTNSWRRKQRENRELREQLKIRDSQLQNLSDRLKQQMSKTKELENSLVSTTRACSQFEKLLQQELTNRTRLSVENDNLNQTISRLRSQISVHEKEKSANNELIRVLNATLMERETEVSILKLKMTRMQTNSSANLAQLNPPSNPSLTASRVQDPCKAYTMAGRSNSEFTRNSATRSTMMADAISTRSSTSQLQHSSDRDALVWATVPEELTPSKRPILLERNLPQIYECYNMYSNEESSSMRNNSSTPILRDRRYKTLPRSMKNPTQLEADDNSVNKTRLNSGQQVNAPMSQDDGESTPIKKPAHCIVTNLDESNNTSKSSGNRSSSGNNNTNTELNDLKIPNVKTTRSEISGVPAISDRLDSSTKEDATSGTSKEAKNDTVNTHYSTISTDLQPDTPGNSFEITTKPPPNLTSGSPSTPIKISASLKRIFGKFRRSDSSSAESQSKYDLRTTDPPLTPTTSAFQRGATRSTLVGPLSSFRAQMSPQKTVDFNTDKPFAEWDTNMLVDWLTVIGLSMYTNQCRRWVKCGAHIMNATPAEVDKGLGITNHLHRKKLRLAISELNGDCDKITKAAAKLDYLWVARWLDDIGLPQYKEAFINARVDGRVLNYLTIEDLVSMGVKSLLHHSSIRCGIKVLRSINFDLQMLKRRATAEEIERMNTMRQNMDAQMDVDAIPNKAPVRISDESDVSLWTCHRVMEWLRMIDFAEFAPNLRGSGVHGGLIMYEDGFNIDTISTLLSIPSSRTLLRRHLSTFFENLFGPELALQKKQQRELSSSQQLNPATEIRTPKKSPLWFGKLKSSKVGQDGMDEYLCPMYPVEPQIIKTTSTTNSSRKSELGLREGSNLPRIPESVNV